MVIDARNQFLNKMAKNVASYPEEQRAEATAHLSERSRLLLKVKMASNRIKKK